MGFAMESQELKELPICIVFRKIKYHFQKTYKIPYFGALFAKIRAKTIFPKRLDPITL